MWTWGPETGISRVERVRGIGEVGVASLRRSYGWEVLVGAARATLSLRSVSVSAAAAGHISAPRERSRVTTIDTPAALSIVWPPVAKVRPIQTLPATFEERKAIDFSVSSRVQIPSGTLVKSQS
jgi:hypothetical protein